MNKVLDLRQEVEKIDLEIFKLIERRLNISKIIIAEKLKQKLPVEDKEREEYLVKRIVEFTALDEDFVKQIYCVLFNKTKNLKK